MSHVDIIWQLHALQTSRLTLPEENSLQIKAFLQRTADAELCETGTPEQPGKQNLPGAEEGDGFFYAKLIKK